MATEPAKSTSQDPISWRPPEELAGRFLDVVAVSKRTKASVINECVEEKLPAIEKRYEKDLAELKRKKSVTA